jgi:uncharacterized protein
MPRGSHWVIPLLLITILALLLFGHYFIYYSSVHFFSLTGKGSKAALALILFCLSASFIAASILVRQSESIFPRALYFSSGLWLGLGASLCVFFTVAWVAWEAVRLSENHPSPAIFGLAAVALACLYSGYGVWNAYHPRIENITVQIKNLPSEWRGKKVVQLSDVHLGHILGRTFLQKIVDKVNAEDPSVVFITGDLFDGVDGRLDELVDPLNDLRAPLGVYFVTGNHETYLGTDRAYAALGKTKARILRDEMVVINGLQIVGVSHPERGFSKDIATVMRELPHFNPRMPSVLLWHDPTQIEPIKAAGVSLQLSGHTHKGQVFPIQLISRLVYRKYYNGLHVEGDYAIYTSSGAGTWGPTMRTGNYPEIAVIHLE